MPYVIWFADVLESSDKNSPPRNHRFDLGNFMFLHQAEERLHKILESMPYKFIVSSVRMLYFDHCTKQWVCVCTNKKV